MGSEAKMEGWLLIKTSLLYPQQQENSQKEWSMCSFIHSPNVNLEPTAILCSWDVSLNKICTFLKWVASKRFLFLISVFSVNSEFTYSPKSEGEGVHRVWGKRKAY